MPSYSKLFLRPFIGGLNTETSDVEDMVLNTSDELNCTILPETMRGRRYGFNIERDGEWSHEISSKSYSGYLWKNVNKTSENFIVQQIGSKLKFYRATTKPITQVDNEGEQNQYIGSVDIHAYEIAELDAGPGPLNYAIGDGLLYVVNENIQPLQIRYAPTEEEDVSNFIVNPFNLYIRDFDGVEDGLKVDEMPTGSTSDSNLYQGLTKEHHYNLLNQGWSAQDLLDFVRKKNKWPSNNLQWFVGKDNSGDFDTERLLKTYFGNTPAPKGHYVINYFSQDRSEASAIYNLSPKYASFDYSNMWHSDGNMRGQELKSFSKILSGCNDTVLRKVIVKFNTIGRRVSGKQWGIWHGNIRIRIFGSHGVTRYEAFQQTYGTKQVLVPEGTPESRTYHRMSSWMFLGYTYQNNGESVQLADETYATNYGDYSDNILAYTLDFDNSTSYKGGYSIRVDFLNGDNHGHHNDSPTHAPFEVHCKMYGYVQGEEGNIFPVVNASNTATDITYMGNRLFYLVNDTVLFSQAIGNNGQGFEKCYQDADPTSEEVSDILPTDGGLVKLNNIGVGRALETFNRGVLVFGDNIVYGLISPVEKLFTATEYDIVELSRAGIVGPRSTVSTDDMVYYWSPLGIFRIGINPNTGTTLIAQSITNTTIQTFYNNIPMSAKKYCRGVFDYVANRIYWYYPLTEDYWKLDGCLVYDLTYNAFMPFKIGDTENKSDEPYIAEAFNTNLAYEIEPTMYLSANGDRVVAGGDKVLAAEVDDKEYHRWTAVQHIVADDTGLTTFGDYNDREFKDFEKTIFDSYMVSKPITLDDTYYNKQVPVMQTLFKRTEEFKLNNRGPLVTTTPNDRYMYTLTPWFTYNYTNAVRNTVLVHVTPLIGNPSKFLSGSVDIDVNNVDKLKLNLPRQVVVQLRGFTDGGRYYNPSNYDVVAQGVAYTRNLRENVVLQATTNASKKYDRYELYIKLEFTSERTSQPSAVWPMDGSVAHLLMGEVDLSKGVFNSSSLTLVKSDIYTSDMQGISNSDGVKGAKASITPGYVTAFDITCTPKWASTPYPTTWEATVSARMPRTDDKYVIDTFRVTNNYPSFSYPKNVLFGSSTNTLSGEKSLMYTNTICFDDESDFRQMSFDGTVTTKVPVLQSIEQERTTKSAEYVAASGAYIRMRWGWSLSDRSNRWDMVQNAYRPQKDFMYDEFVESRMHIRGRGKAFQVEIRNDENKDMRLAGLNLIVRNP